MQGEQRAVWYSKDMHVFLCLASASALYRGLSPESRLSSAALLRICDRDTHSSLGLAYVLHPLLDAASLQTAEEAAL